jgi:cell division protease FtsH
MAAKADDAAGVASSRMSYSRFLEYLEMGRVKKVSCIRDCMLLTGQCVQQQGGLASGVFCVVSA